MALIIKDFTQPTIRFAIAYKVTSSYLDPGEDNMEELKDSDMEPERAHLQRENKKLEELGQG